MICITLASEAVGFGAFSVFCRLSIGIGELLLCTIERLIEEQIRRHHQSAGLNLKTESEAMWSPDTICVPFGDAQDAAYFAQVCRNEGVPVIPFEDKTDTGYNTSSSPPTGVVQ